MYRCTFDIKEFLEDQAQGELLAVDWEVTRTPLANLHHEFNSQLVLGDAGDSGMFFFDMLEYQV